MNFFKLILIDTILDLLYFPVWWYSGGLVLAFKWVFRGILDMQSFLGIDIWVRNLFTPMYGQVDIQGKIVSFFMRIFQIIFRSFAFLVISAIYFLIFIIYLILPIIIVCGALIHVMAILG